MSGHFIVGPEGDVYEPDGYSVALSKVVVTLLVGAAPEYAARKLSVVRRYLNFRHPAGDAPRAVLDEPASHAVSRFRAFMDDLGYPSIASKKANREEEFEMLVPGERSTAHSREVIGILRQFYQLCGSYDVGGRTRENPIELPGWHRKTEEERRDSWSARYPKMGYGWLNAGLRFRPANRKAYLPMIEDPTGCGTAMTAAVIAYGCPDTVIAICVVLEENGCRWREAAWANALGWSIRGFGEVVYTTNKFDPGEHAKKIVLRPDVLSGTIRRFDSRPHPTDPGRTMMDHLRELAAAGDSHALRAIPLFPNSLGRRHQHRTFNGYWFRPAMEAWENEDGSLGLLIFSDVGARRPTPHWYRHCEITRSIEKRIAGLKSATDIVAICKAVCRGFGLKTDQAGRYAAGLMRRLAEEAQQRNVIERRAELAALRGTVAIPAALPGQLVSEAEMRILQLPDRHREAA